MGMLSNMFPEAQFVITGVLGPKSNAHGPDEFMHIGFTKKITACVASVVAAHFRHHMTKTGQEVCLGTRQGLCEGA